MKNLILYFIFISIAAFSQTIGEFAPPKESKPLPPNAWGVDVMFGEGGFGLGTFYRSNLNSTLAYFIDFSISEAKDEKEMEYIDYWGNTFVVGKQNRIFMFPLNFGVQYRLFEHQISDNFRPYITAAIGPSMVLTTPYAKEFFNSFAYAKALYTLGGYIGIGANFGSDDKKLMSLNIRYYHIRFFDKGVEGLKNRYMKHLGGIYVTLGIGSMF